jgi:SAM-dependent methyltransferase
MHASLQSGGMRWIAKAVLQKGLSALPAGERVNYAFQRHVTRSLPSSEKILRRRFRRAIRHLQGYLDWGPGRPLDEAVFYEFGSGWELTEPISSWCLGVERHILVDVRPNMRLDLVNLTLERINRLLPELEEEAGRTLRDPGAKPLTSPAELESRFGIVYLAPCDARATGLATGSIDFVSSTSTLEHIPEEDLEAILRESRRLLRPDGIISCRVDLGDHFAYFDRSISRYNFLRYSARTWRLFNSSLMYQNRLRYPDYLNAFARAGFELLAVEKGKPRPENLRRVAELPVASDLRERYSREELAVKSLTVVARPLPAGPSPHAPKQLTDLPG